MSEMQPTKVAYYNGKQVRAYLKGQRVYIDHDDLDAITGHPRPGGEAGYENPDFNEALRQAKNYDEDFSFWLNDTFGELTTGWVSL